MTVGDEGSPDEADHPSRVGDRVQRHSVRQNGSPHGHLPSLARIALTTITSLRAASTGRPTMGLCAGR